MTSMREAIRQETTLTCACVLQGHALKVALAPCREIRQVGERMTKWKRKVERQKERWQIWAGDEGGGGDSLKKKKRQELKKVRMTAHLNSSS